MSDYLYNLSITGRSSDDITHALKELESIGVIPDILEVVMTEKDAKTNLITASLSSESVVSHCWYDADHNQVLHDLSLKQPGLMFELHGEDMDSPNNYVFQKGYHNGLYKEATMEKQDIGLFYNQSPWRVFADPAVEMKPDKEAETFALYKNITAMQQDPLYKIAADMAYIQNMIEPNEPLTEKQIYTLATKLNEASESYFSSGALHEEFLDGLRYLVENGINPAHSPAFPKLSPEETLQLLLNADNTVFGTLVEAVTIDNQFSYNQADYDFESEDIIMATKAIEEIKGNKPSLFDKIAGAQVKAASQQAEQGKAIEEVGR